MVTRIRRHMLPLLLVIALSAGLFPAVTGTIRAQAGKGSTPVVVPLPLWNEASPFNALIPEDAQYLPEERIGTFRHGFDEWSMPIYRIDSSADVPPVTVTNRYSGRTESWPIPITAEPASAADAHMAVIIPAEGMLYEFWDAEWTDAGSIEAGGMMSFPLDGPGISDPPYYRVTAAGFAVTAGMIIREDFLDPISGELNPDQPITHALSMSLPFALVTQSGYVSPAVGGETQGEAGLEGVPLGAQFALARDLDVDALDVHPLTREVLRAARDYGMYVNDTNGSQLYEDQYAGAIRIEPGLVEALYDIDNEDMLELMAEEVYAVVQEYGLYRVVMPGVDPDAVIIDAGSGGGQSEGRGGGRRGGRGRGG
ncbi:MAG: hypothetical protein JXN59_18535 [Anaerolineae bacterium]|nr:hypothetical protein [Anaerolineae bacterium]